MEWVSGTLMASLVRREPQTQIAIAQWILRDFALPAKDAW